MSQSRPPRLTRAMDWLATAFGSRGVFVGSIVIIVVWALTGPLANFSDTWQLVINTGTTVVTLVVVIAIQYAANRDTKAVLAKLDALIACQPDATNEALGIESEDPSAIAEIADRVRRDAVDPEHSA